MLGYHRSNPRLAALLEAKMSFEDQVKDFVETVKAAGLPIIGAAAAARPPSRTTLPGRRGLRPCK
jgi:hypothetical protein